MIHLFKKYIISLLLVLLCAATAWGQQSGMLRGKVTEPDGTPLIGATVTNAANKKAVMTDANGQFSINANAGDRITITMIGFATQTLTVGIETEISVTLIEDAIMIDELVVVGYGTVKRSTMVGSVEMVQGKDIERRPVTSVGAVLVGASAGLMATSSTGIPGDDPSVRIRGFGTIHTDSTPLIIVDGAEFTISLRTMNPQDIESVSILKDASATAIYGSRGANGVIMITTKQGRSDKPTFKVSLSQGLNMRFIPEQERASPQEYYQLMFESKRNSLYFDSGLNMDMATANYLAVYGGAYRGNA